MSDDRAPRSLVVVGAGLAGAQAVTAARAQGFTGRITLLGAEGLAPYDRPPLSKELLTRAEPAWLSEELGTDLGAVDDLRLATAATGLTVEPHGVTVLTTGGPVHADVAVLATGSVPVLPAGWAALTLHTAGDAALLRSTLVPGARLIVIGAGWIGAEVAGVAAAAGVEVTVLEAAGAPLAGALGERVGGLTAPWYPTAGARLHTGVRVTAVEAGAVTLADGRLLTADVVLAAVGARPASAWLRGTLPLLPDGSLAVDADHRVPGTHGRVAAVGDLASRTSPRHGVVPGGHWDGALRGPAVAVAVLLGGGEAAGPGASIGVGAADLAPYVFSTQLGHDLALVGLPDPADDVVLRGDPAGPGWSALWFAPGTDELRAVVAVDRPGDVGAARRLFRGPTLPRLERAVAADPSRPLR